MATTRARNKQDGRYTFDGGFDRLCVCGHRFGVHLAAAPHDCDNHNYGDGQECRCEKFKPAK